MHAFLSKTVVFAITGIIYFDNSADALYDVRVYINHASLCLFNMQR